MMPPNLKKEILTFARFLVIGLLTYLLASLQMTLYLKYLHVGSGVGYSLTQVVLIIFNFTISRAWIFKSKNAQVAREAWRYLVACIFFRAMDWSLFMVLHEFFGWQYLLAIFVSLTAIYPIKYFTYRVGVFKNVEG